MLLEVIWRLRNWFFEWCELDCVRFIGMPSLAQSFYLKKTGSRVGLITDKEQFRFVEESLKGGISWVKLREAEIEIQEASDDKAPAEDLNDDEILYIGLNQIFFFYIFFENFRKNELI